MSITKKNIADELANKVGLSNVQALEVANEFFNKIKQSLSSGKDVKISGFGNFVIREKTPRPGRNPKTGDEVMISARKVVTFKAGPKLKMATKNS
ncbi:MAG TPA: integration host factor subunit alpha [Gammaproteobacteria bacterium]|jgi:integration host factor subunit alpha|nr:integration host factor subunit alpha [Gammaproteobacteria bacterium]HAY41627.1 integration host factor subunit alpha [Gammaproteobacteria bacterium]|tara:strand:- start:3989 stop:4273 length:285 start_codon:yes stop_codon:yes gene_type:complete